MLGVFRPWKKSERLTNTVISSKHQIPVIVGKLKKFASAAFYLFFDNKASARVKRLRTHMAVTANFALAYILFRDNPAIFYPYALIVAAYTAISVLQAFIQNQWLMNRIRSLKHRLLIWVKKIERDAGSANLAYFVTLAFGLCIVYGYYLSFPTTLDFIVFLFLIHVPDLYALAARTKRFHSLLLFLELVCSFIALTIIVALLDFPCTGATSCRQGILVTVLLFGFAFPLIGLADRLWAQEKELAKKANLVAQVQATLLNWLTYPLVFVGAFLGLVGFLLGVAVVISTCAAGVGAISALGHNTHISVVPAIIIAIEASFWSARQLLTKKTGWFHTPCPSCRNRVLFRQFADRICQCPECGQHFLTKRSKLPNEVLDYGSLVVGTKIILSEATKKLVKALG
jgi:hypothetical protein